MQSDTLVFIDKKEINVSNYIFYALLVTYIKKYEYLSTQITE